MYDPLSTQVVVGVAVTYLLQWLKKATWFPLLSEQSAKIWKVLLSAAIAAASALGIAAQWNGPAGELLITGLTGAAILNALIAFGVSFISQHASYELLIHSQNGAAAPKALITDAAKILAGINKKPLKPVA